MILVQILSSNGGLENLIVDIGEDYHLKIIMDLLSLKKAYYIFIHLEVPVLMLL